MKYRCKKGCFRTTRTGGKMPLWHASRADCPYEPEYGGPREKAAPSESPPPAAASSEEPPPVSQPAEPGKPPSTGILRFGSKPASVTSRAAPQIPTVEPEWEVDGDHSLSFFELIDNILLRVIHFIDRALKVPKPYEGKVLLAGVADEELVKKKMGRRLVTRFTKALGAKTQEEAHGIIDSGGVLVLVGSAIMSLGSHFIYIYQESEVLKKRRERKKARFKKVEEQKTLGQTTIGESRPPPLEPVLSVAKPDLKEG